MNVAIDAKIKGAADAINLAVSYSESNLHSLLKDRLLITCV